MGRFVEDFLGRFVARFGVRALDDPFVSILLIGSIGLAAAIVFGLTSKRVANQPRVEMTPLEKLSHDENKFDLHRFLENGHTVSLIIASVFLSKALLIVIAVLGWTRAASKDFFLEWLALLAAGLLIWSWKQSKRDDSSAGIAAKKVFEWRGVLAVFFGVTLLKICIVDWSRIVGDSLRPEIEQRDFVIVSRISHGINLPLIGRVWTYGNVTRNQNVIYKIVETGGTGFGRVIGLPGESIDIDKGNMTAALKDDQEILFQFSEVGADPYLERLTEKWRVDMPKAKRTDSESSSIEYRESKEVPAKTVLIATDTWGAGNPLLVRAEDIAGPIVFSF